MRCLMRCFKSWMPSTRLCGHSVFNVDRNVVSNFMYYKNYRDSLTSSGSQTPRTIKKRKRVVAASGGSNIYILI